MIELVVLVVVGSGLVLGLTSLLAWWFGDWKEDRQ